MTDYITPADQTGQTKHPPRRWMPSALSRTHDHPAAPVVLFVTPLIADASDSRVGVAATRRPFRAGQQNVGRLQADRPCEHRQLWATEHREGINTFGSPMNRDDLAAHVCSPSTNRCTVNALCPSITTLALLYRCVVAGSECPIESCTRSNGTPSRNATVACQCLNW